MKESLGSFKEQARCLLAIAWRTFAANQSRKLTFSEGVFSAAKWVSLVGGHKRRRPHPQGVTPEGRAKARLECKQRWPEPLTGPESRRPVERPYVFMLPTLSA